MIRIIKWIQKQYRVFIGAFLLPAISLHSLLFPEISKLPVDMLSQILYDKTEDVGKLTLLLSKNNI